MAGWSPTRSAATASPARKSRAVADGTFEVVVAPRANPGNWLPTGGIERYELILRLYDTAVGVSTKAGREGPMPAVLTRSCPGKGS